MDPFDHPRNLTNPSGHRSTDVLLLPAKNASASPLPGESSPSAFAFHPNLRSSFLADDVTSGYDPNVLCALHSRSRDCTHHAMLTSHSAIPHTHALLTIFLRSFLIRISMTVDACRRCLHYRIGLEPSRVGNSAPVLPTQSIPVSCSTGKI